MAEVLAVILDHKDKVQIPRDRIRERWRKSKSLMTMAAIDYLPAEIFFIR